MSEGFPTELHGRRLSVGATELWVETAGEVGSTVLLLAGSDAPGSTWPQSFVAGLVDDGFRVLRFDYRDCGRSSRVQPSFEYSLDDLAADAIAILDQLRIDRVHLVGFSMGAMVGQVLALQHGDRVASLCLLSGTPGAGDERLSEPEAGFVERIVRRHLDGPPTDRVGVIEWLVERDELLAGSFVPFDRAGARLRAQQLYEDGQWLSSGHGEAIHRSPSRLDRLAEIRQPTLVIHGSADPVYPTDHAKALAAGIHGAVLMEIEELGHELPEPLLEQLRPIVVEHFRAAGAREP